MRILKIMLVTFILGALAVPFSGCGSESDEAKLSERQIVTVERGNLTVDITASGNLALSCTEDLVFDIFYPEATVEEVLVEEGDTVEEGQELARLSVSEWEDELEVLEDRVTAAVRQIAAEERDLSQAQLSLETAKYNLDRMEDVQEIKDDIEEAEWELKFAKMMLLEAQKSGDDYGISYWMSEVANAKDRITEAERDLAELLGEDEYASLVVDDVKIKALQVKVAEENVEAARVAIEDAREALADAQEELDEARSYSPVIVAPFDGFITRVNVEGGDEVLDGTVAVQLADPNKFEAEVMVSEMDIMQVKLEGEATVQVDAMQGLSLPAKVTHIAPTATIQQGVVNYKVKVEVESLEAVMKEWQEARREVMEKVAQGELPERLKQAIKEGRITQERAEEMMKQKQQGQGWQQGRVPTMFPGDFQLREGLTVTVSILVDERNDVLLVPNSAITTQGGRTCVQVLTLGGAVKERVIQTGISNWQYTEVIGGLSEGEQVVVPKGTTATSIPPPPRGPMPFFGRPPRR